MYDHQRLQQERSKPYGIVTAPIDGDIGAVKIREHGGRVDLPIWDKPVSSASVAARPKLHK